jgi:hypothetical protein
MPPLRTAGIPDSWQRRVTVRNGEISLERRRLPKAKIIIKRDVCTRSFFDGILYGITRLRFFFILKIEALKVPRLNVDIVWEKRCFEFSVRKEAID